MRIYPETKEEAEARTYGAFLYVPYCSEQCVERVYPPDGGLSHQCHRKPGHGPDGLYCKQHAKMVEAALAAKE